jgi:CBS domain-containing protein
MWAFDCGCVPVCDGDDRVVGMITDRDICLATYFSGKPPREIAVGEAMARHVLACAPADRVAAAEMTMRAAQVRRLPVIGADGRLVGILSLNDIAVRAADQKATNELTLDEVARTLGAISYPRDASHARALPV